MDGCVQVQLHEQTQMLSMLTTSCVLLRAFKESTKNMMNFDCKNIKIIINEHGILCISNKWQPRPCQSNASNHIGEE